MPATGFSLTPSLGQVLIVSFWRADGLKEALRRKHLWRSSMMRSNLAGVTGLVVAIGVAAWGGQAFAIKQFADEFMAMYVEEGTPLAAEVDKAKCNVCHVGKSKKDRNAYGQALAELLDKKEDKENKEKIRQALETVASKPSAGDGSPTFGDLIKQGKLPGGSAE
jgi:hypothetical protein